MQLTGERFDSRYFLVRYCPASTDGPRLGLVASRRIGNAVMRNRCKRRIRELFRRSRVEIAGPVDIVVVARRALATAAWADVEEAWQGLLKRIKQWHQRQNGTGSIK